VLNYLSNVFMVLQNSAHVGGRFLGGRHTLQNSASDGGFVGTARGKALQRSGSDICSAEF
jgi:hypothetical protein